MRVERANYSEHSPVGFEVQPGAGESKKQLFGFSMGSTKGF